MKNQYFFLFILFFGVSINLVNAQKDIADFEETVFVFGGDINLKFVQYVADLTKQSKPRICYLPTASADNPNNIKYWEHICHKIGMDTIVLEVWVSASSENKSFEDILLDVDAIVVGGGNTLNMLGIWKAQGIDTILHKALKKGIVLAGGSAGSICWFENGISDSRPVSLSVVEGLGVLGFSNCPHYSDENRKALFHKMILEKKISGGYACDDLAGVLFRNGKAVEAVSQSDNHLAYFVGLENEEIRIEKMPARILLSKDAIGENDYTSTSIRKRIGDLLLSGETDASNPLNAYVSVIKTTRLDAENATENSKEKALEIDIEKIFIYDNKIAGVLNGAYQDFYGLWYFYNCNGIWKSMGEDIGGESLFEGEIKFREKAKVMLENAMRKMDCKK